MSRNKEHRGAFGGRPVGSVFFVSAHSLRYIMSIFRYSLYIPYIFHIFPKYVPYISPCVFLNLWSHLGEPSGGNWGNPGGPGAVTAL